MIIFSEAVYDQAIKAAKKYWAETFRDHGQSFEALSKEIQEILIRSWIKLK